MLWLQFWFTKQDREDYGQSLAKLGAGPGCYIVLPILGPSTARDTVASVTNFMGGDAWYNVAVKNDATYFESNCASLKVLVEWILGKEFQ